MSEPWSTLPLPTIALRLGFAIVIGALIGWDRQRHDKPAGVRTHMLVALGSATFVVLGFEVGAEISHRYGQGIDPTRVLQGVVGGIGFLGAGSIIKGDGKVQGITTAASVWVSGALGAAAGMGAYLVAGVAVTLAFLTLVAVGRLERVFAPEEPRKQATARASEPTEGDDESQPPPGALG
jgi:putative Mg2+ transporter-C (MgtC) family protein